MELVRGDKRQQRGVEIWDYFKVKGALKKGSILRSHKVKRITEKG